MHCCIPGSSLKQFECTQNRICYKQKFLIHITNTSVTNISLIQAGCVQTVQFIQLIYFFLPAHLLNCLCAKFILIFQAFILMTTQKVMCGMPLNFVMNGESQNILITVSYPPAPLRVHVSFYCECDLEFEIKDFTKSTSL